MTQQPLTFLPDSPTLLLVFPYTPAPWKLHGIPALPSALLLRCLIPPWSSFLYVSRWLTSRVSSTSTSSWKPTWLNQPEVTSPVFWSPPHQAVSGPPRNLVLCTCLPLNCYLHIVGLYKNTWSIKSSLINFLTLPTFYSEGSIYSLLNIWLSGWIHECMKKRIY